MLYRCTLETVAMVLPAQGPLGEAGPLGAEGALVDVRAGGEEDVRSQVHMNAFVGVFVRRALLGWY